MTRVLFMFISKVEETIIAVLPSYLYNAKCYQCQSLHPQLHLPQMSPNFSVIILWIKCHRLCDDLDKYELTLSSCCEYRWLTRAESSAVYHASECPNLMRWLVAFTITKVMPQNRTSINNILSCKSMLKPAFSDHFCYSPLCHAVSVIKSRG